MQQQQSLPLGFVRGEPVLEKPENLYIPPDALELLLDAFSGPMDLLLYLIRREKLDILDLPILAIIRQYMAYVEMMR
ncbi:MAG: segregation/condensation protein A, partial [Firmicutes bacterium]|nr:segregation/condensation protein A [Bacillota bacterium]